MKALFISNENLIKKIKKLESGTEFYQFLVENRSVFEFYIDADREVTYLNKYIEKLTGYSRDELLNNIITVKEIIHPDDLESFKTKTKGYARQITKTTFNFRIITKNKEIKRVKFISDPLYNNHLFNGNRITIKEVKTVNESKVINRLKKKIDKQNDAYNKLNKNWQNKIESLHAKKESLERKLDYILSPSSKKADVEITDLIDINQLQTIQNAFCNATGVASIITDLNGKPITEPSNFNGVCKTVRATKKGAFNCSNSDKCVGKKAKLKNKPTYQECTSCGFMDAGAPINIGDQQIAIWMIGQVNIGQLTNEKIREYGTEIGANVDLMMDEFAKLPITEETKFKHIVDFLWILADEISNLAFHNLELSKKIKELKTIENELIVSKKKSDESDELKTAFLNSISHEIRTPMNAIIGFTELLTESNPNGAKRKQYSKIIIDNTQKLLSVVTDLLTISSLNRKQEKLHLKETSINYICDRMFDTFYRQLKEKSITLIVKKGFTDDNSLIITDINKLSDIITRLLDNAIKFSNGTTVELGYTLKENNVEFYIKDSGIGIDDEKQSNIFKLFSHLDVSIQNEYGGTGLGLSIVKELIHLLKGDIWVKSKPNKGSTFYFTIPYKKTINSDIEMPITNRTNKKSITILIAEDNESNYLFLEEILKGINCKIIHAVNGKKAVDICKLNPYIDLILMDIKMPILDGHSAAIKIKEFRPEIPIIAQSAFALEHEKIRFSGNAFNEYVTKPINKEELIQTIKKIMSIDLPIVS